MDLVRKNEFFELNALLTQSIGEIDALRKRHIAIIVAMDQ